MNFGVTLTLSRSSLMVKVTGQSSTSPDDNIGYQVSGNWKRQELSSCWDGRPCQIKVGQKVGATVPLSVGEAGSPFNTISPGPRLTPCQVASWSIQPFGHNIHGPPAAVYTDAGLSASVNCGSVGPAVPLSMGELGLHPTRYGLSRGLSMY